MDNDVCRITNKYNLDSLLPILRLFYREEKTYEQLVCDLDKVVFSFSLRDSEDQKLILNNLARIIRALFARKVSRVLEKSPLIREALQKHDPEFFRQTTVDVLGSENPCDYNGFKQWSDSVIEKMVQLRLSNQLLPESETFIFWKLHPCSYTCGTSQSKNQRVTPVRK